MAKKITPHQLVRYKNETDNALENRLLKTGYATQGIHNKAVALKFASFVSQFAFLDESMERVLSMLIGTDLKTASLISRKIVSVSTRISIMKTLLEKSPKNKSKGSDFDVIIKEFGRINTIRNKYVHSYWETYENDDMYLVIPKEDPFALGYLVQKKFKISDMSTALKDIFTLMEKIENVTAETH